MLPVFETYFTRFEAFPQRLSESVKKNVGIIVAIPCYNEPDILKTLQSLLDCEKTDCAVEIIVAVNYSETASQSVKDFNASTYKELCYFAKTNSSETCKILPILASDIPTKQAGVGYARKIAMDEATHRFASIDNPDGIIVACDSDSLVANNYLREIEQYYIIHPTCTAANIYFEHPLEGKLPSAQYEAIAQYELHLRYYVEQLKRIGFPYAYHTVGSSFSLRAKTYCRQGGMNKRQAGEDFYFLQKLFQTEHIGEINTTTIFPSSRISDRVETYVDGTSALSIVFQRKLFRFARFFLSHSRTKTKRQHKNPLRKFAPVITRFYPFYGIREKNQRDKKEYGHGSPVS